MNRLSNERAAYLRHAAHQHIDWYPWGEEAFERARQEDKPVFLSSGGVWCHWCHVMAKECFENEEITAFLNKHFINIKLDRDERPDIDRIYQQAVAAMGKSGGWPLSIFLTPGKEPFFGGTYFPPEDRFNMPGFLRVLKGVSEFYRSKRGEISEFSSRLMDFIKPKQLPAADVVPSSLETATQAVLGELDRQNGGFGTAPKFHMPGAMEFLIMQYISTRTASIEQAVRKTLTAMAKGGYHDQIGGGFHRYSVDESWIVPHFEKMLDDNAWLLRNYCDAYTILGDEHFKEVAGGIIGFVRDVLSDPEGGFYASQDADVTPEDEGGYFTWTDEDLKTVLTPEEYNVISLHLCHERGSLHHDPLKRVLFISMEPEAIAKETGMSRDRVTEIIKRAKETLLLQRNKREAPFIDTSLYTALNGIMITAYFRAYRVLHDDYLKDFALKTLRRIMKIRFVQNELFHAEGIRALLDDYMYLIEALLSAYEVTGDTAFKDQAVALMDQSIGHFWDTEGGGFFDSRDDILGVRLKGIEDIPHPSPNALAVINLVKLFYLTDKEEYHTRASQVLKAFSVRAQGLGIHSAYYAVALDTFFKMISMRIESGRQSDLAEAARTAMNPYVCLVYGEDNGYATPCRKGSCYEPLSSPESLTLFLKSYPSHG